MIDDFSDDYFGEPLRIDVPDQTIGWVFAYQDSEGGLSAFTSERVDKLPLTDALIDWLGRVSRAQAEIREYQDSQVLLDAR